MPRDWIGLTDFVCPWVFEDRGNGGRYDEMLSSRKDFMPCNWMGITGVE
jgi:hypothetical protein